MRGTTISPGLACPLDVALECALGGPSPVVLSDTTDATTGGAVGDSTELLRTVVGRGGGSRLLSIRDGAAKTTGAGEGPKSTLP